MRLDAIIQRHKDNMLSIARLSAAAISAKVVSRTPVDSGRLRQSWTPKNGAPDFSNAGGDFAVVANSLQAGDTFTLANGQPYVRRIEYEGHSPQAPTGMLRISVAEWQQIVRGVVRGN